MAVTEFFVTSPMMGLMEPMEAKMSRPTTMITFSMVCVWAIFLSYMVIA